MKKIVIPTDFSENAGDALNYAINLLSSDDSEIHILHVVEPITNPVDMPIYNIDQKEMDDANENLKVLEGFSKNFFEEIGKPNIHITTNVVCGPVDQMIQKEAEEVYAHAIVMGTQGTNHSSFDKFIGTVSTGVINDSPCPTILVPRKYNFKPIDKIVFSTNLNHGDPYELWRAVELIKPQIGVIRCLHVAKDENMKHEHDMENYAKYLVEHSPTIQTFFDVEVCDDVEKCIVDYTELHDAQLMVMHKTKKTFWEKLFGVSHTSRMASALKVPLLIMN